MPKLPSAEELVRSILDELPHPEYNGLRWEEMTDLIRADRNAVLEEAAKTICSHCDLGSKLDGQHHRWQVYGQEQFVRCKALSIRALKTDL